MPSNKCYICSQPLGNNITSDHIIPNGMFKPEDKNRPQLMVHKDCNNQKSKDDRWFAKKMLFMCSTNPEAESELINFLNLADSQKPKAYLLGQPKGTLKDYKLARTIFEEYYDGMEYSVGNQQLVSFKRKPHLGQDDRLINYVKLMLRGLYVLNVPGSQPNSPSIRWLIYDDLNLRGKLNSTFNGLKSLFAASETTRFTQQWGYRLFYIGSKVAESDNKGYIYMEFYERIGLMAKFE